MKIIPSSRHPIRFDRLHPGSLFKIVSEPSRGVREPNDDRLYRRAESHQGFYAHVEGDKNTVACLAPYDIVQPVRVSRT